MSKPARLAFLCLGTLLFAFFAAGCWDAREPENLGDVLTMGVDRSPDSKGYVVTVSIALPSLIQARSVGGIGGGGTGGQGGGAASKAAESKWIVTGTGLTIADAYRSIQESSSRRPFSGYLQLVVVGEDVARQGIAPVIEFLERNREIRRTINILVTPGSAQTIVSLTPETETLVALMIRGFQRWERYAATGFVTPLRIVSDALSSEGVEVLCGRIVPTTEVEKIESGQPSSDEYPGVGPQSAKGRPSEGTSTSRVGRKEAETPGDQAGRGKTEALLAGAAAFKGDRLVGWFDRREARGYLLIRNRPFMGMVTVALRGDKRIMVSMSTHHVHTNWRVSTASGKPVIELVTDWTGTIDQLVGDLDLSRPESMGEVQHAAAVSLANDMRAALHRAKDELHTDVFGFGEAVSERDPHLWRSIKDRWNRVYPDVKVSVTVRARISRAGLPIDQLKPK